MRRLSQSRIPLALWGPLGLLVILLVSLIAIFGTSDVTGSGFQLKAVFTSDAQLGYGSPVRIAGIDVGTVTGVHPLGGGRDGAVAVMSINPSGLPIHADATAKIRTRLLLEGNFFVDLNPGTPGARTLHSGATIAANQTSGPVQLDRVLSSLTSDTRANLQTLLQGFGDALGGSSPAATPGEDPSTQGETGGQALNQALVNLPAALLGTVRVTQSLQGEREHDLSALVGGSSLVVRGLAVHQGELADLVTNLNTTLGTFAARENELGRSIALLPGVLTNANAALGSLDRSFPPTKAFTTEILPGIRALPSTIAAGLPWLKQARLLLSRQELGGLLTNLAPAVRDTTATLSSLSSALDQVDRLDKCLVRNLLPTSKVKIVDPPFTSRFPVYEEFFQTIVGIDSATQDFDGNGHYVRGFAGGGANPESTSSVPQQGPFLSNAIAPALGTRPAFPDAEPPYRTDVACASSQPADLNAARTGGTP